MTREQERRGQDALADLLLVGSWFPSARAAGAAFDAWAGDRCACVPSGEVFEGIERLPEPERARILREACAQAPRVWESALSAGVSEGPAEVAVLAGAVRAALAERCEPSADGLWQLDHPARDETEADALALVLDAADLWSVLEAARADAALAALDPEERLDEEQYERAWSAVIEHQASRLTSRAHRTRLERMIARLESRLPFAEHPVASETLRTACRAFRAHRSVRRELAAALLADAACVVAKSPIPLAG